MTPVISMNFIDYTILAAYVIITIVVGYALKKYMKTSEDFFLSGRSLPSWITSLAFLSANLGALEVIGMVANSAKYGILTVHFYWIGAIPAMIFLGIFMMPFYYSSRVRSVPEYLKLRYNEATRGLNALSFAIMTLLMSGISMYAMALLFELMLGWSLTSSILLSAIVVLIYVFFGGLSSSIYNEVIQFFLIWLGLLPVVYIGLHAVGGFEGLVRRIPASFMHAWQPMSSAANNPMGVDWIGVVLGLGFVLSFGYWTTDFLVVQRAMASEDLAAARRTPLVASFPKMLVPIIVVIPGLLAVALLPQFKIASGAVAQGGATPDYNSALILMFAHYLPNGILGLAITGLLASFMSGMAGNVTAFNTVWTYDIYGSYIKKNMPDQHYLKMGKYATIFGVLFSVGTAYIVQSFPNHHGLHATDLHILQCSAVCHLSSGHVLEKGDALGRILRTAERDTRRRVSLLRALSARDCSLSQRDGGKLLPGMVGMVHRLRRHNCRQPLHRKERGVGTGRAGLRADAKAPLRLDLIPEA